MINFFKKILSHNGFKLTKQRKIIAQKFFSLNRHITAIELLREVKKIDNKIGLATIYRFLKLLQKCNLVESHNFSSIKTYFEPKTLFKKHHDHLICRYCKVIIEFSNFEIKRQQKLIAEKYSFIIESHKLEIYGQCNRCFSSFNI